MDPARLRRSHVEFIRIGSKQPVVQPQRITPSLVRILKRYHPLWMSIHFTHPEELTRKLRKPVAVLLMQDCPWGARPCC